jgi:hypothetical protein
MTKKIMFDDPNHTKKLNEYFLRYTKDFCIDLKKEFKTFVQNHYNDNANPKYTNNPYLIGQEKELISDAYENFIGMHQEAYDSSQRLLSNWYD